MNLLQHVASALETHVGAGIAARGAMEADPLVQGAEAALQAYTRASDAYAQNLVSPSVALWTVLIAAGVVLLEWLLARFRHLH